MIGGLILLGLTVLGAVAITIGWSYTRVQPSDLGYVSRRWLAERRF
jgi:hypothetical protein